jgi:hypothetical protein
MNPRRIAPHVEEDLEHTMVFVAGPRQSGKTTLAKALIEARGGACYCEDVEGVKAELRFFRNTAGREVHFILLRDSKPWMAVEVKLDDRPLDPGLRYLLERVKFPHAFQLSLAGKRDFRPPDIIGCRIRILPAARFLANLP